ncbi:uncharacterized protein LOC144277464 isoform X1 [Eretmochelys imbricata]
MEPSCRAQAAPRVSVQRSCRLLDMASSLHQGPALTALERALLSTMAVFHTYSGCRGSLRKVDLKTLINRELPQFVQEIRDPRPWSGSSGTWTPAATSRSTSRNTPRWSPC